MGYQDKHLTENNQSVIFLSFGKKNLPFEKQWRLKIKKHILTYQKQEEKMSQNSDNFAA